MYIDGFVIAVPTANKQKFIDHVKYADSAFVDMGAIRIVECWADDVKDGKTTDFRKAVALEDGETVVLSWLIWPDKETAAECMASMETDARWQELMDMPFDGRRMVFGDFEPIFEGKA